MWQDIPLNVQGNVLLDVVIAAVLGGLVGFEREAAHKAAGMRTHMLAAMIAALLVGLAPFVVLHFQEQPQTLQADPIRIIQAIVIGFGFLGAGAISHREHVDRVQGLTTAASVLLSTTIGITVGVGALMLATGLTLLTLIVLRTMRWVEARLLHIPPPSDRGQGQ